MLDYYEDVIELDLPIDKDALSRVEYNWVQYNPRKENKRWGCSITSLDGSDAGIPDLDSLLEYNTLYNTNHSEQDFITPTCHAAPFAEFLTKFKVGRSHYIKLGSGGHFPWHRDSGRSTFRLIYTINNCHNGKFIWLEDEKMLHLKDNAWYYINTKKRHSVFAFDDVTFAVFNVLDITPNIVRLQSNFRIK